MKYHIRITEELQRTVEVEANDKEAAIASVQADYNNESIVLDNTDFNGGTDFDIVYPE